MADPLKDPGSREQESGEASREVSVPVFDPVTPGGRRARWALLISSLITLGCLVAAITSEHYIKEWRTYQRHFEGLLKSRAQAEGKTPKPFHQEIKQITAPSFDIADRCTTCHLRIDDPEMARADQPFRSHPTWVTDIHPVEKFGCTPCHGGQGLATTKADAHGNVAHWEDPLIPPENYQAGCGSCHTHVKVAGGSLAEYGGKLFERNDCFACHQINGRGRGNGPDLSTIGGKRLRTDWHRRHLALQRREGGELWWQSYGPLDPEEVDAINSYLNQLVGAPDLVHAKATAFSKGCLGCHRINGVGGDDGPDLSNAGKKRLATLDFSNVREPHTLAQWHKAHLRAPGQITPDSQMPQPELNKEELEAITLYLLSLRGADAPINRWPTDRIEAVQLGIREFATDGESLFKTFCSACHGETGQGARFGISSQVFPAVTHRGLLAVASDRFIRRTLLNGRPGRRMPAWGSKEGGLRLGELDALIGFLRSNESEAPVWDSVSVSTPDLSLGASLYGSDCASCHGQEGEGGIGPELANSVFLGIAEPYFIYSMLVTGREDTAMGKYLDYSAGEMSSIIGYIQSWREGGTLGLPALPSKRSIRAGEKIYSESCSQCHGRRGEGGIASNLVNAALLETASDGFLAAAVRLGRCVPPTGSPEGIIAPDVTDQELADAIEFVRQRLSGIALQPPGRPARGNAENGGSLYLKICAGCHGNKGMGGTALELSNPEFQATATDGYLEATIIRGRPSAGMPAFGSDNISYRKLNAGEAGDIVRYLRTLNKET